MNRIRNTLQALGERIMRQPSPVVQVLPILFTFIGPGLVLLLIVLHIPVDYPQETMAPYPKPAVVASH